MLIQTKIQIEPENFNFIKKVYKDLKYRSLSEYMREAINAKVQEDRKRLRELKRLKAMEMIGKWKSMPQNFGQIALRSLTRLS